MIGPLVFACVRGAARSHPVYFALVSGVRVRYRYMRMLVMGRNEGIISSIQDNTGKGKGERSVLGLFLKALARIDLKYIKVSYFFFCFFTNSVCLLCNLFPVPR